LEADRVLEKRVAKANQAQRQCNTVRKECANREQGLDQILQYKQSISEEIQHEEALRSEIAKICRRYKKLILDQKRDKEKLASATVAQRKIVQNLSRKKEVILEDSNKIYLNF